MAHVGLSPGSDPMTARFPYLFRSAFPYVRHQRNFAIYHTGQGDMIHAKHSAARRIGGIRAGNGGNNRGRDSCGERDRVRVGMACSQTSGMMYASTRVVAVTNGNKPHWNPTSNRRDVRLFRLFRALLIHIKTLLCHVPRLQDRDEDDVEETTEDLREIGHCEEFFCQPLFVGAVRSLTVVELMTFDEHVAHRTGGTSAPISSKIKGHSCSFVSSFAGRWTIPQNFCEGSYRGRDSCGERDRVRVGMACSQTSDGVSDIIPDVCEHQMSKQGLNLDPPFFSYQRGGSSLRRRCSHPRQKGAAPPIPPIPNACAYPQHVFIAPYQEHSGAGSFPVSVAGSLRVAPSVRSSTNFISRMCSTRARSFSSIVEFFVFSILFIKRAFLNWHFLHRSFYSYLSRNYACRIRTNRSDAD